jgi:tartrate dehydrogenase/decarboxylase/D-malate dehydrogenase
MRAVELVTERGEVMSPDLGGRATTDEVTEAVVAALKRANA